MIIGELLDRFESIVRKHHKLNSENHSLEEAYMVKREYITARKQLEQALSEGSNSYDDRKAGKDPSDVDFHAIALDYAKAFACGLFGPYADGYPLLRGSHNVKPTDDGPAANKVGGEARNK